MGYEYIIPPVPDRLGYLQAMAKLEDSWLNQSMFQYNIQEDLRYVKIAYGRQYRVFTLYFLCNFSIGLLLSLPIGYAWRRFFIHKGPGIPFTPKFTGFVIKRDPLAFRKYYFNKHGSILTFVLSFAFAAYNTDSYRLQDPKYNQHFKVHKMM